MENHSRVTGWHGGHCNPYSWDIAWKFIGYQMLMCSFSSCWQNFSKANCFRVYRKLITWSTNRNGLFSFTLIHKHVSYSHCIYNERHTATRFKNSSNLQGSILVASGMILRGPYGIKSSCVAWNLTVWRECLLGYTLRPSHLPWWRRPLLTAALPHIFCLGRRRFLP